MPRKLLLLSDIPPCSNYTGGIALAGNCGFLKEGAVAAFIVLNPELRPEIQPHLAWIPMRIIDKPNEIWDASLRGTAVAIEGETYNATVRAPQLVAEAAAFGRSEGVDAIWAILEGQTITRMALPLARELNVPLYCHVWDPLSWWLSAHGVDEPNARQALRTFDETISGSRGVVAASWAMAEHYRKVHGVRSLPVIYSHDKAFGRQPAPVLRHSDRLCIAMVGQFYADDAWAGFTDALCREGWKIAGREVFVYYLGNARPSNVPGERLIQGGWKTPPEAVEALSCEADVCYCPYPFGAGMEEVARFSFPSKMVLYAASGRPIFCHAPLYSSPARYLSNNAAGIVCGDRDGNASVELLKWLVKDPVLYTELCAASNRIFRKDFTHEPMRENFRTILELDEDVYDD